MIYMNFSIFIHFKSLNQSSLFTLAFTLYDKYTIESHIKSQRHKDYVAKVAETQQVDVPLTAEQIAEEGRVRKESTVRKADERFRRRILFGWLRAGLPLNKAEILRRDLESLCGCSLGSAKDLPTVHLKPLFEAEKALQSLEFPPGTLCSMICDGTTRLGEVFNVLVRFICTTSTNKVVTKQLLIHLGFLKSTLDSGEICGELKKAMNSRRMNAMDVIALSMDGCAPNITAHRQMEEHEQVKWLLLLCLSHMASNAGKQAGFPTLKKFWTLLQKIFANSESAKEVYREVTGSAWVEYSDTRWYSEHEVYQSLYTNFQFLETIFSRLVEQNICCKNALEVKEMLLCPKVSLLLKIELAAYVEGLMEFVKFCYNMEADGEIPFLAGAFLEKVTDAYPNGDLPSMPSVDRLVGDAVKFVEDNIEYQRPGVERPQPRTLNEVTGAVRPRRQRAVEAVRNATRAVAETAAQRNARELQEAAERERVQAQYEQELQDAIEREARLHAEFLPQNVNEWKSHIESGIKPAITYFFKRINEGGDRFDACQIFRAARLFDPMYAKDLDETTAHNLIENLCKVARLDNDETINALKDSFSHYKSYARTKVVQTPPSILQWHFDFFRSLDDLHEQNVETGRCNFCRANNASARCFCIRKLKKWWNVAQVLALLAPSSGASERVFSLLNLFFGPQRNGTLHDMIFTSLCFSYNKREYDQFEFEDLKDED